MDSQEEAAFLAAMRGPYLASAGGKATEIVKLLCRCVIDESEVSLQNDPDENEESPLVRATRLAHSLAGSGASYGFPEVSAQARQIEQALKALPEGENDRLRALLETLATAIALRSGLAAKP